MIEYMNGMHGFSPQRQQFPASAALAKGIAVALNASGKLVVATGASPANACIGILDEAATAVDQICDVTLLGPDAIVRTNISGSTGPALAGSKFDTAADGLSVNMDDTTDPKFKLLGLWPGETTLWMAVNISFIL